MSARTSGLLLVAAAALFWTAWLLMPGVGVTDPERIFQLVSSRRSLVALSVVIQLASAALYVPAMLGILATAGFGRVPRLRRSAGILLVGAIGSAADAVLHLLAYAMTQPRVDSRAMIPVMAFLQGPGLSLLAPLLLSFFVGGAGLSIGLARAHVVSRWSARLYGWALATAIGGGGLASAGVVPSRGVGLAALGLVSAAQIWVGIALWRRRVVCAKPPSVRLKPDTTYRHLRIAQEGAAPGVSWKIS